MATPKPDSKLPEKKLPPQPATWLELLPNFIPFFIGIAGFIAEIYFGNMFLVVWGLYVLLPAYDFMLPIEHINIAEDRKRILEKDKRYFLPLYAFWFADMALFFWTLHRISTGEIA